MKLPRSAAQPENCRGLDAMNSKKKKKKKNAEKKMKKPGSRVPPGPNPCRLARHGPVIAPYFYCEGRKPAQPSTACTTCTALHNLHKPPPRPAPQGPHGPPPPPPPPSSRKSKLCRPFSISVHRPSLFVCLLPTVGCAGQCCPYARGCTWRPCSPWTEGTAESVTCVWYSLREV